MVSYAYRKKVAFMKLNEKIIELRKSKGMSQVDLADALNLSRQTISKWENGDSSPDISNLSALASLFGVTTDSLLNDQETACTGSYPAWLDHLPSFMKSMIARYGWLYGVKMMISGALFTGMGCLARFMFRKMIFGTFASMDGFDPFSEFDVTAWSVCGTFTSVIIGFGIVIMIIGAALAYTLKKWGAEKLK